MPGNAVSIKRLAAPVLEADQYRRAPNLNRWSPPQLSQQPPLRERHHPMSGNDEMVERPDVDERERLL